MADSRSRQTISRRGAVFFVASAAKSLTPSVRADSRSRRTIGEVSVCSSPSGASAKIVRKTRAEALPVEPEAGIEITTGLHIDMHSPLVTVI